MESGEAELHIIETQKQSDGKQAWLDIAVNFIAIQLLNMVRNL